MQAPQMPTDDRTGLAVAEEDHDEETQDAKHRDGSKQQLDEGKLVHDALGFGWIVEYGWLHGARAEARIPVTACFSAGCRAPD